MKTRNRLIAVKVAPTRRNPTAHATVSTTNISPIGTLTYDGRDIVANHCSPNLTNLKTMIKNTPKIIGLVTILAGSLHVTAAPYIVQPVAVTASSVYDQGLTTSAPENTINGNGLDGFVTLPTGTPIPAEWPAHTINNREVSWHAEAFPASPLTITFELGNTYHLTGMHLWNMNQYPVTERGLKTATVSVSSDGTSFTEVPVGGRDGNGYFRQAVGEYGYRGEDYTFVAEAKWVRFSITSNWNDNLQYAGLSEVRFIGTPASPAVTLTTNTTLSSGDTTYEGANLIVSNCTLTVNGSHSFEALLLKDGAVLTHSPAPNGETDNRLSLTITSELTIGAGGWVNVNGRGYAAEVGDGAGAHYSSGYASGAGHGGLGGNCYGGGTGGGGYDSVLTPVLWGSGGGAGSFAAGGSGGGAIQLAVGGTLQLDGVIEADGATVGWTGGGGAGGSIQISAGTIAGSGAISAQGGSTEITGGGGGGGRIALHVVANHFEGEITANGGLGYQHGDLYQAGGQSLRPGPGKQRRPHRPMDAIGHARTIRAGDQQSGASLCFSPICLPDVEDRNQRSALLRVRAIQRHAHRIRRCDHCRWRAD